MRNWSGESGEVIRGLGFDLATPMRFARPCASNPPKRPRGRGPNRATDRRDRDTAHHPCPTVRLVQAEADKAGRKITVGEGLAKGAFEALLAKQTDRRDALLAETAAQISREADVLVLAQGLDGSDGGHAHRTDGQPGVARRGGRQGGVGRPGAVGAACRSEGATGGRAGQDWVKPALERTGLGVRDN
jgi:hypothetical protein